MRCENDNPVILTAPDTRHPPERQMRTSPHRRDVCLPRVCLSVCLPRVQPLRHDVAKGLRLLLQRLRHSLPATETQDCKHQAR
jgi:hypothetical protein